MIRTHIKTPIVFYRSIGSQKLHQEKDGSFGVTGLLHNNPDFMSFQTIISDNEGAVERFELRNLNHEKVSDAMEYASLIKVFTAGGVRYVCFNDEVNFITPSGLHYIYIKYGNQELFSAYINYCIGKELARVQWTNQSGDIDPIKYNGLGFMNTVYLDADVHTAPSQYIEEGDDDETVGFIPHYQRFVQRYKIDAVVTIPELDALSVMPLHDDIYIFDKEKSVRVRNVKTEAQYPEDGLLGTVSIEFETEDKYIRTNCQNN